MKAVNAKSGMELATRLAVADRPWSRLKGLWGREALGPGEGLLLVPCNGVHTFGMSLALDLVYLGAEGDVVALHPQVAPNRVRTFHPAARCVLELPAGTIAATRTRTGDTILLQP